MSSRNRYTQAIEQAAGEALPVPDAAQVYQTTPPPIPRKRDKGWRFTNDGLTIERELSEADWSYIPAEIRAMKSAIQLNIGDATLYGLEHGYIQSYEDMEKLTGYKAGTIEMYTSLCRSIPRLVRTNSLTYSHYQQIAPLPEEERPLWIGWAATSGISYRALRALIEEVGAKPSLPAGDELAALQAGMPDGVTVERVDIADSPTVDDEEEATDLPPLPNDLDNEESWQVFDSLQTFIKERKYDNPTTRQRTIIRNKIRVAKTAIALLEAKLRIK